VSLDTNDAEIYTHRGSREFVRLCTDNPESAERQLAPMAIGELETYARMRAQGSTLKESQ